MGVLSAGVGANPFSMTTRTTFTIDTASTLATYTSNGQANIVGAAIPEPGSMLLLGTGLVYLASRVRNRKQRNLDWRYKVIDKPYAYHKPSMEGLEKINKLRAHFSEGERLINEICPNSRQEYCNYRE